METGFKDPIAPRKGDKEPRSTWNFECPQYDNRMRINAGTNYGVGFNNPVGTEGVPSGIMSGPIPFGKVKTLKDDSE
ncbi:MAG: hypothetical protein KGI54_09490 [Pseudomonadota bacterium]|nr:hypothetical protein [Pseudomonadota bacterium]